MSCAFMSEIEPKTINEALMDDDWIIAMEEELHYSPEMMSWHFFPSLKTKVLLEQGGFLKIELDEQGKMVRNKARLVAQDYN